MMCPNSPFSLDLRRRVWRFYTFFVPSVNYLTLLNPSLTDAPGRGRWAAL